MAWPPSRSMAAGPRDHGGFSILAASKRGPARGGRGREAGAENSTFGGQCSKRADDRAAHGGESTAVEEIGDVILRSDGGSTVRLRDVGRVVDGFEERTSTTRLDGADAVSFSIKKQSGANTAAIAERVHATLDRVRPTFPTLQIRPVHDDAEFIRENVAQVREAIIFGALMAVLVIFVFMRDWRRRHYRALALPTVGELHVLLHVDGRLHDQNDGR